MSEPRLNRMLTLETPERAPDGAGGFIETWQPQGTLWGEVKLRGGSEKTLGTDTISSVRYRIITRGSPFGTDERPRPDQRLRDGQRIFRIDAVADLDADGRFLACFVTEEMAP